MLQTRHAYEKPVKIYNWSDSCTCISDVIHGGYKVRKIHMLPSVRELYIGIFGILMLTYGWHCHLRTTSRGFFSNAVGYVLMRWGWVVVYMHIYDEQLSIIPAQSIKWAPSFIREDEGNFAVLVALPGMQVFCGIFTAWLFVLENDKAQSLISVINDVKWHNFEATLSSIFVC